MQTTMIETTLHKEFVSPKLAQELHYAGLTDNVPYFWLQGEDQHHICTFHFDPDDYYRSTFELLYINNNLKAPKTIPAYRLTDLEDLIAGYTIQKRNADYHIMLATEYGNHEAHSQRLPDAYAQLIAQMLRTRIINIDHANQQLTIKKLHDRQ